MQHCNVRAYSTTTEASRLHGAMGPADLCGPYIHPRLPIARIASPHSKAAFCSPVTAATRHTSSFLFFFA